MFRRQIPIGSFIFGAVVYLALSYFMGTHIQIRNTSFEEIVENSSMHIQQLIDKYSSSEEEKSVS